MTDRTHPDSGRIITSGDILLHDAQTALMYEELRAAIDDGHESMTHADALAEIAAIRAENVELRAQLEAIGAGGVSGPLMGRGSIAASAGSEPVATVFTMEALAPGGGVKYHATVHKPLPAGTKLYTHPSTPEGMVGGWRPIETAPKDSGYLLLRGGREQDIASGYWLQSAYAGNGAWIWPFVHMAPRFWAPLPPSPSSADEGGSNEH